MKQDKLLLIGLFFLLSLNLFAQESRTEKTTLYQDFIAVDTVISPDYYTVYITIAEYKFSTYERKTGRIETLISCDSIFSILQNELLAFGIEKKLKLVHVGDKKLSESRAMYLDNPNPNLKQETYIMEITRSEDVEKLYRNLSFKGLQGIKSYPFYTRSTLDNLKSRLKIKALAKADSLVQIYAEDNNYKVIGVESITEDRFNGITYLNYLPQNDREMYDVNLENKPIPYHLQVAYNLEKKL